MNVYDFDKTIYNGDSSTDFCLYNLRKYHRKNRKYVWGVIRVTLHHMGKGCSKTNEFKQEIYHFLETADDIDKDVEEFWELNRHKIASWYLEQKQSTDVIVSGSPNFLLEPIIHELGVSAIGTDIDKHTGQLHGENNVCANKVDTFKKAYPNAVIDEFYSDSDSDLPMARLAKKCYKVSKGSLSDWEIF